MVDLTKPVRLTTGGKAIIGTMLPNGNYAGAAEYDNGVGGWAAVMWRPEGVSVASFGALRLENVPERVDGWVNFYAHSFVTGDGFVSQGYPTKAEADVGAMPHGRIACIYVSFEKGEGL